MTSHYTARRRAFLYSASAVALFGASIPRLAYAQGAGLEEIVVTARKQAETLVTVPLSISALTGADLEARGAIDPIIDLQNFVPGFSYDNDVLNRNDRGYREYAMRGMEPATPSPGRGTVGVFVDGEQINGGNLEGLSDVERVEVIRGPQSAYFGRATFAGAINYITRDPGNKWGGQFSATVAEFGTTDIIGSVEGPIVEDKLSFRVGAHSYHTDGDYTNLEEPGQKLGERDTKSISGALVATPNDNLKIRAHVTVWKDEDGLAANALINNTAFNCNGGAAAAGTNNYICGPISSAPDNTRQFNSNPGAFAMASLTGANGTYPNILGSNFLQHFGMKRDAYQAHITGDYSFLDGYTLSAAASRDQNELEIIDDTSFRNTQNATLFPNPNFGKIPNVLPYNYRVVSDNVIDQDYSGEIRLTSPQKERFKWMAGANYYNENERSETPSFGQAGFLMLSGISKAASSTYGLFASANYEIVDHLTLSGEARYQWDHIYSQAASGTNLLGNPANVIAQQTFKSFSPRVILDYEFAKNESVYVSWAEGHRPGEFNTAFYALAPAIQAQVAAASPVTAVVPEEKVWFAELGVKGDFADDKLRVMADVYYGDWPNRHIPEQIPTYMPNGTLNSLVLITVPGGVIHMDGIEAEIDYKVSKELTLESTFDMAATKVINTYCSDCLLISGNAHPYGTQLPFYSKYHATLAATYERPITSSVDGYVRVDYLYTGRIYDTEGNYAWLVPTNKINLHVGAKWGNYRFELYGTNITNNRVPIELARNTDSIVGGNSISVSLADKATYGAKLSAKF